jgi:1,2-diacylglycerol 3-alpha-glucosyltransferase
LLIVGQSSFVSYKKRLEKISDSSVIFAGFVPDGELPEYYAASTVYATASLWEGYDMPLAEAQACGKRVVAFDVGSHREVIDQNGILVTRNDIHAFSQALIKQISHVS